MGRRRTFLVGKLLFAVSVFLLVPVAVALALTGTFKGETSQRSTITIKVVNNKVVQKHSTIFWLAKCGHGHHITGVTDFGGALKHDKFALRGKYTSYPGGPSKEKNNVSVRFRLTGQTIKGTFTLSAVVYYEGVKPPQVTNRCKTGKITFTARTRRSASATA